MKCAFLYCGMFAGGSERVTLNTIQLFKQMGIESCIFAQNAPDSLFSPGDLEGIIHRLPCRKSFLGSENTRYLVEKIREQDIQVLFIVEALRKSIPRALYKEPSLHLVHWEHSVPFWELVSKRSKGEGSRQRSLLKWLEWETIGKLKYVYTPWKKWSKMGEYKRRLSRVDKFIVLCEEYREELCALLGATPEESARITPMYNTIALPEMIERKKAKQIVYVGRLCYPDKRLDRLIEVWRRVHELLPDWRLDIYGDGPDRDNLQALIDRYRLPRISLAGYVECPSEVYRHAAVLCMTSAYEGYPMSMIEAQSHGVVPLAFECCSGIRSIIGADQRAGILVPPFDLDTYATELVCLCRDEVRRAELQEGAIRKSLDYAHHTNIPHWYHFFASLGLEV